MTRYILVTWRVTKLMARDRPPDGETLAIEANCVEQVNRGSTTVTLSMKQPAL